MAETCDASKRQFRRNIVKIILLFTWLLSLLLIALTGRWQLTLFWGWFLGSGVLLVYCTVAQRIRAWKSLSWVATEATVMDFSVGAADAGKGAGGDLKVATLRYEYTVDGQTYSGGDAVGGGGEVSSLRGACAPGSKVIIYYDPQQPWDSATLSVGTVSPGSGVVMLLGVAIIVLCVAAAISEGIPFFE
jgi:hypothetical protein